MSSFLHVDGGDCPPLARADRCRFSNAASPSPSSPPPLLPPAALAEDYNAWNQAAESTRSRAEVQAELVQYKQSGVNPSSIAYNPLKQFRGSQTRAQVVGDYLASRDRVAAFTGEDSGSAYLARKGAAADAQRFAGMR